MRKWDEFRRKVRRSRLLSGAALIGLVSASLVTSASASACPNEALRSELRSGQLPDCRAYELVSPLYKEGALVTNVYAVSSDGSRIIGGSLGTFAGAEQLTLSLNAVVSGAAYLLSRTATGWAPAAINPPASQYYSHGMFDASADLEASLWELGPPDQPQGASDLYIERPLGTFTKIGPPTPSAGASNNTDYTYLGGSEDLSRILFSAGPSQTFRWPFDETISGGTLYEYSGVEQAGEAREPALVGVEGGSGSKALVSHCGTRLGSSSPEEQVLGSVYNAVSASGSRVFFTAVGKDEAPGCAGEAPPVGELFAREETPSAGGEIPVGGRRTVAISEPSKEDCDTCITNAGLRDAVFQGASQDGTKVFFTTEQELLPELSGENLLEYDFERPVGAGHPGRLSLISNFVKTAGVQGVARISEDGSHVYYVATGAFPNTTNSAGSSPVPGEDNLYVYERDTRYPEGHTWFVATLSPSDAGEWSRADERLVLTSSEGRFLVFTSMRDLLDEGLLGSVTQVFQYDSATSQLVRVSIGQNGYNQNGRAPAVGSAIVGHFPAAYAYSLGDSPTAVSGSQAPANGAVFFSSPDALTPLALSDQHDAVGNLVPNIYEYRAGQVYLLSDGRDTTTVEFSPSVYLAGSDASGGDVFFFTADSLLASDGDTQQDLYDARVGGGLRSLAPPALGCAGEACHGGLAAAPALSPFGGSATQHEEESAPPIATPAKAKPKAKKPKRKPKIKKRPKPKIGKSASAGSYGGRKGGRTR